MIKGYYTQHQPAKRIRVLFYSEEHFAQFENLAISTEDINFLYNATPVIAEFEDTEKNCMLLSLAGINDNSSEEGELTLLTKMHESNEEYE